MSTGCAASGRIIGPFIEIIALLYRERRRRHRMDLLAGITQCWGRSLDLREILAPLGEAVRPAIGFDAMGVIILDPSGRAVGVLRNRRRASSARHLSASRPESSRTAPALMAGRTVLFDEASRELNLAFAGDRVLLTAGLQSCLWVPMHFGDEVGGTLFFGKHEPRWYDSVDVEVATAGGGSRWSSVFSTSDWPRNSVGSRPWSGARGRSSRA